ncbi:MAG: GtrA family protein [Patescibacteria group bacterium]
MISLGVRERRFLRYVAISGTTFLFDLALLWVFVEAFDMHYLLATALALLIAVSLNYLVSRRWVFQLTERKFSHGYFYFIKFALIGMTATTGLMWMVTSYTMLHFLVGRTIVALFVGSANYVLNLYLNFKVVGKALK